MFRLLFGLGLDGGDGHTRITRGPNFHLLGGSEPTHERMQETCIKFNEALRLRRKTINDIDHEEARLLLREIEERL